MLLRGWYLGEIDPRFVMQVKLISWLIFRFLSIYFFFLNLFFDCYYEFELNLFVCEDLYFYFVERNEWCLWNAIGSLLICRFFVVYVCINCAYYYTGFDFMCLLFSEYICCHSSSKFFFFFNWLILVFPSTFLILLETVFLSCENHIADFIYVYL